MSFGRVHEFVARWEGGFVEDRHDPGGATKWGVTVKTLIAKALDFNNDGVVNRLDVLAMTKEQALEIYKQDYWLATSCDVMPEALALVVYDCAVNQGTARAKKFLQIAIGVKADGVIGPQTRVGMLRKWQADPTGLLREFCARRAVHYSSLAIVIRFGLGWYRRLFDAHGTALKWYYEDELE